MNLKQFDKIVTDQLSRSELVLMGKGTEYAEEATDETEVDRLAHFKKAAALQDMTTAQAAFGTLSKRLATCATERFATQALRELREGRLTNDSSSV